MRYLLLLPVLLFFFSCHSPNPEKYRSYPKARAVIEKFRKETHVLYDNVTYLDLAKKPDGWYILRKNRTTLKTEKEYLFWSAKSHAYVDLRGIEGKAPNTNSLGQEDLDNAYRMAHVYDRSIYYGYENWSDDVISELGSTKELSDSLLESLAYAYADKNMQITRPTDNHYNRVMMMTDAQADDFCEWGKKEMETWSRLEAVNPDYETIVGKVKTKIGNQYIYLWSELQRHGKDQLSKQFMEQPLYDDFVISFAKNTLNSAPQNAIIFTNGDNDTYPLWYVQEKLGVRKDVAVLNISLSSIPDWVYFWQKKYAFKLTATEKFYRDTLTDWVMFTKSMSTAIPYTEMIEGIEKNKSGFFYDLSTGTKNAASPATTFYLGEKFDTAAPYADFKNSYLLKSDLVVLDVITSNIKERPVGFTSFAGAPVIDALKQSSCSNGLLLMVTGQNNSCTNYSGVNYNVAAMEKNMESNYTYSVKKGDRLQVPSLVSNYAYMFDVLVKLCLQDNDTLAAKRAVESWEQNIPVETLEPGLAFYYADDLLKVGKTEKSRSAFMQVLGMIEKDNDPTDKDRNKYILDLLSNPASAYPADVARAAGNLMKKKYP